MNINLKRPLPSHLLFKRLRFLSVCAILFLSFTLAGAEGDNQYKVQTAFIYQFTNYITWPQEDPKEAFVISVLGHSPLIDELEELAKTRTVKGRKIQILHAHESAHLKKSDILFVAHASEKVLEEALKKTKGSATLTISSTKGFAEKGSMINFYVDEGRIRFEINRQSLDNEKIQISSQLLKLAKLIN